MKLDYVEDMITKKDAEIIHFIKWNKRDLYNKKVKQDLWTMKNERHEMFIPFGKVNDKVYMKHMKNMNIS